MASSACATRPLRPALLPDTPVAANEDTAPLDPQALRRTLGQFATGVTVITARAPGGERVGVTCNSFSSVSLSPPLVLWSLRRESRSHEAFRQATHFAVNVLGQDQQALSGHFASRLDNKFDGVAHEAGLGGAPTLPGCAALLECELECCHEGGDHVIFIGRVLRHRHHDQPPLIFHNGAYLPL